MKIGDIVVYVPIFNIDIVYKIIHSDLKNQYGGLYGDENWVVIKDSSKAKYGNTRIANKLELQLANEEQIAKYIAEMLK